MLLNIILLVVGLVLLVKGADWLVDGASALAVKMKIPPIIIGLTVVAMGTSAPEAAVSISSALSGSNAIAIGNVLGSNIANILLILGLAALFSNLKLQRNTLIYEIPFVALITAMLCGMGMQWGYISRAGAGLLLIMFAGFFAYLFKASYAGNDDNAQEIKKMSPVKMLVYIAGGLAALVLGSNVTVTAAVDIATIIGISQRVVGLTIVAVGTSLPELVTSVVAARKGQSDIAIGNIIGSNIFNILFVLGIAGLIRPIPFNPAFWYDGLIAIGAAALLFAFTARRLQLKRSAGIIFLILYAVYLGWLIM